MTQSKDVINWQFVDKYYNYLNLKIQRIDSEIINDLFILAIQELEQIFIHINKEIQNNSDTEKYYKILKNKFKDLYPLINKFDSLKQSGSYSHHDLKQMSELKRKIRVNLHEIYEMIMSLITDLNMFFPKVMKDTRMPIYKS